MSYVAQAECEELRELMPVSGCMTGEQCEMAACRGLAQQIALGEISDPGSYRSRGVVEPLAVDPYELMSRDTRSWHSRETNLADALEIFAKQGNVAEAVEVAHQLRCKEMAIHRLMSHFAHNDDLYHEVKLIARSPANVKERIQLNAIVEAYYRQDSLKDKELFKKLLRDTIRDGLEVAATIVGHGRQLLEEPQPAL